MGNSEGANNDKLSEENLTLILDLFKQMDGDGNEHLDMTELLNWWGNNYPEINSRAIAFSIDENSDGCISLTEWVTFWERIKEKGVSNSEIANELNRIRNKESWKLIG